MMLPWKPGALRRETILIAALVLAGVVLAIGLFLAGALWRRKTAASMSHSECRQTLPGSYTPRKWWPRSAHLVWRSLEEGHE